MKTLTIACCFILSSLSLASCKKDRGVQPKNALIGDWIEQDLNSHNSAIRFTETNQFQLLNYEGTKDLILYNGTYKIKLDSIFVTIETNNYKDGKPEVKPVTTYQLYDKATFKIEKDILTLKYITYPADAPVFTTAKFVRRTTID